MEQSFVALITARGGSKGLPRKNVIDLNGRPLIGWTIKAALDCPLLDRVFVSTEDTEIAAVSRAFGAEVISRPAELAHDTTSSELVIKHTIDWLEEQSIHCSNMVLLQPTSPLRTSKHISESLEYFNNKQAHCVISVFEPPHTPIKAYMETANGSMIGLYSESAPYSRRQDLPRAFQPNGAIYAFSIKKFTESNHIPRTNVYPYIMNEQESADIDTIEDLHRVEEFLKEQKS